MLDMQNLVACGKAAANTSKSAPVAFSYEDKNYSGAQVNELLRTELNELAGTFALYRENQNKIFSFVEEVVDDVVPNKVKDMYADMAETKTFRQGEKPIFRRKINARTRAKQFITRVGLEGVYEVFKLGGSESFEVPTSALGGAAQIGLEEFLDGRVDFSELLTIVLEGIEEAIQFEVGKAMIAGINQLPGANVVTFAGFDETEFDRLLFIADSYGAGNATIYCDFKFASKLMPAEIQLYTEQMKNELWQNGYFRIYKGHTVVILPNSVADERNESLALDPGYCWIIPNGANDKPVRIAFEGDTLVDERKNADWSRDVQVYKKVGVVALLTNDICVYHDTSLTRSLKNN